MQVSSSVEEQTVAAVKSATRSLVGYPSLDCKIGVQEILGAGIASHGNVGNTCHTKGYCQDLMRELVTSECHIYRASYQICLLAVNPLHDDDETGEDRIRAIRAGGDARLLENPLYSTQGVGACLPPCHIQRVRCPWILNEKHLQASVICHRSTSFLQAQDGG